MADDLFQVPSIRTPVAPKPTSHSLGDTLGAAMVLENPVISAISALHQGFAVDPDFDVMAVGPKSDLWNNHGKALARAGSQKEFDYITSKIRQEQKARMTLADQGVGGILAAMGAGLLSPTTLIPLVGPSKGAKGVAEAFALAAASSAADEAVLFSSQQTRTAGEAFTGIAAGTVLGGLLGSAAVGLRTVHAERLAKSLEAEGAEVPRPIEFTPSGGVIRDPDIELSPPLRIKFPELEEIPAGKRTVYTTVRGTVMAKVGNKNWGPLGERSDPNTQTRAEAFLARADLQEAVMKDVEAVNKQAGEILLRVNDAGAIVRASDEVEIVPPLATKEARRAALETAVPQAQESTVGAKAGSGQFQPRLHELDEEGKMVSRDIGEATALGAMAPAKGVGEVAAWTSPVLRSINQPDMPVPSQAARETMLRLSDSGVGIRGNESGLSAGFRGEGTVEHRLRYYDALVARAYQTIMDAYVEYLSNGKTLSAADRIAQWGRIQAGLAPQGKLNFAQFKEGIVDAMNLGDAHDIPEIASAAQDLRKNFFEKFNEAQQEAADVWGAKSLYSVIPADEESSYFRHHFLPEKVESQRADFINDVSAHFEGIMNDVFARRREKMLKSIERDTSLSEILLMEKEEALAMIRNLEEDLATATKNRVESPLEVELAELRKQRRDLVDAEFERLEEKNVLGSPETTAANKRLAKEATQEEYEILTKKISERAAALPPETVEQTGKIAKTKKMLRSLKSSFGAMEAKQADALRRIEDNEEMNISALTLLIKKAEKLAAGLEKLDDAKLDEELLKLEKSFASAAKSASRGEETIVKLENGYLFDPQVGAKLDEVKEKQVVREKRLDKAFDRLSSALTRDREQARLEILQRVRLAKEYTNKVNSRRAVRNEELRKLAETKYDPARVLKRAEELREQSLRREEEFVDKLRAEGATDIDGKGTTWSFAETAREYATMLANKIAGHHQRIAQVDMIDDMAVGLRSPFKRRALNLPYETKRKYLDLDPDTVLMRYANTVGADIELYRAFGDRTGGKAILRVQEDLDRIYHHLNERMVDGDGKKITPARREKDLRKFAHARVRRERELKAVLDRIRNVRGLPADPRNWGYRLGKLFLNMNVATMMGSALLSSIPDAARVVMAHGVRGAVKDSWQPLLKGLTDEAQKQVNGKLKRELRLMGVGIDVLTHERSKGQFDIMTYDSRVTKFEKGWEWLANKTPVLAGFGQWTDLQKQITGMATMARLFRIIDDVASGTVDEAEIAYLAKVGINLDGARRIHAQQVKHGTKFEDVLIPNTESWDDYQALRIFHAAMAREDARLVISPGLEKPLWMDEHIVGRVLGQFRSFTMAANTKMLIAGLQEKNAAAFHTAQGVLFSLALGAVSYYIWAITNGSRSTDEMRKAGWENWLDQALFRSGLLGAFSELQSIGSKIPATRRFTTFADSEIAGRRADSVLGAILGPSWSKASDLASIVVGLDEPTQSTVTQSRKVLPWQNLWYLKWAFEEMEKATGDLFNLPERRQ